MREPRQPKQINSAPELGQTTVAALPPGGVPIILVKENFPPHSGHTPLELSFPNAPPHANDVRKQKIAPKTIPDIQAPNPTHMHPHHYKTMPYELQVSNKTPCKELKKTPTGASKNLSERLLQIREADSRRAPNAEPRYPGHKAPIPTRSPASQIS